MKTQNTYDLAQYSDNMLNSNLRQIPECYDSLEYDVVEEVKHTQSSKPRRSTLGLSNFKSGSELSP